MIPCNTPERFHRSYTKAPGCWPWHGRVQIRGYGIITDRGRNKQAHRYALELKLGRPIKPGYLACHTCHNKLCVNPDHIYEGTVRDNIRDNWAAGTAYHAQGEKNGHAILDTAQVIELRKRRAAGECLSALAREYGIAPSTACQIVKRLTWRHVA